MDLSKLLGPRPAEDELGRERLRYLLPTVLLSLAALCLVASVFTPYWRLKLLAPQYPGGLEIQTYVNRLTGDVREIDGLNHYIGMRPLGEAAPLERSLSLVGIVVLALLVASAIYVHTRWAALLALPAVLFPAIFLGDLYFWLWNFGQNLDPRAPLSSAVKPFVPPIIGTGYIGQFRTIASVDRGFYLALLASVLIVVGLFFHRRAYKPLVEGAGARGKAR